LISGRAVTVVALGVAVLAVPGVDSAQVSDARGISRSISP
jgi:hypothetical protein